MFSAAGDQREKKTIPTTSPVCDFETEESIDCHENILTVEWFCI
jgi:hypothetical protein